MMEDVKVRLGTQLATARHCHHWTLNDVARRVGRQPGRISEIEGGKANSTVHSLSEVGEAVGLSLVFVPNERIAEVLNIVGTAKPQARSPVEVTTAYDDVFIPEDRIVVDDE